jgi:hypothetical protein
MNLLLYTYSLLLQIIPLLYLNARFTLDEKSFPLLMKEGIPLNPPFSKGEAGKKFQMYCGYLIRYI